MPTAKPVTTTLLQPCSSRKTNLKRQEISKEIKEYLKKQKQTEKDSCCYGCEEATYDGRRTIFVKGFQHLRPRDEIKNELSNIFGSCGTVSRVFVPMQCGTCVPLGFAFIDYSNGEKGAALKLNGSYMGGRKLEVKMATDSDEYYGFVNFDGCDLCRGPGKLKLRARKPFDIDKAYSKIQAD